MINRKKNFTLDWEFSSHLYRVGKGRKKTYIVSKREEKKEKKKFLQHGVFGQLSKHESRRMVLNELFWSGRDTVLSLWYVGCLFYSQTVTKKENKSLIWSDIAWENKERKQKWNENENKIILRC